MWSFGINNGYSRSKSVKNDKNPQKFNEAGRIEDFEHEKPYHTLPEYPV
jgi:hypothetical protein